MTENKKGLCANRDQQKNISNDFSAFIINGKKKKIKWDRVSLVVCIMLLMASYLYGQHMTREIASLEREVIELRRKS